MADNVDQQYGDYHSDVELTYATTPRQSLAKLANNMSYSAGCSDNGCSKYNSTDIKIAITGADVIIVCLGTGMSLTNHLLVTLI